MADSLRALRELRGWTHDDAADAMGISRGGYIKLERGETRVARLVDLAHAAGAERADDFIRAEPVADVEGQGVASNLQPARVQING